MKKLKIYIILSMLIAGLMSCADNENFSSLHGLTADEIAEIARQDSIEQAQKEKINADLVLEYTAEITISAASYDGTTVAVEIDKIAELFGLSEADVLAGIAGESGAPEIKGFAMEGETHADVAGASNTNAPWGHWWDAASKVTTWGETAMNFAEFNVETGEFYVGQYPGHLTDGQTVKIIEALKYNELRVAVVITVNATAPGQIGATVVSTQDLSVDLLPRSVYDADSLHFDLDQALADLGVSSMDEVSFVGVNEDGSFATEYTADAPGFWYDMSGYVGSWGDDASVYTSYGNFTDGYIGIGQFPDRLTLGQTLVIKYGLLAGNKIVMLNITINIVGFVDPETPPAGDPEDLTADITLSKTYSDNYATVESDIKEVMRNAFKMTTYQIHQAINSGELKLYQGAVSETDPAYSADVPGYWLNPDGTVGTWGEGAAVWCSIGHNETELYLYGGNYPDAAFTGSTVTTTYIATLNGGSVTFNITFNVLDPGAYVDPETPPAGDPEDLAIDVTLTKAYSGDYATVEFDVKEVMRNAFKMTTFQIYQAISSGELKLYQGEVTAEDPAYSADVPGYWLNADGTVGSWGGGAVVWCSIGHSETDLYLFGGNHPDNAAAGNTVTTTYIATLNGGSVTFNITFNVE